MKFYITLGQKHTHSINGKTFDKDTVALIECSNIQIAEETAFNYFGAEFSRVLPEDKIDLSLYPKGIIKL